MTHAAHIDNFVPCWSCGDCLTCDPHTHEPEERGTLRAEVEDWRNREAAICPEDFGFEEVITALRAELAQAREGFAKYQKSAAQRHVDDLAALTRGEYKLAAEKAARERAEEEIAKLRKWSDGEIDLMNRLSRAEARVKVLEDLLAAEKAARERAEARVKELEDLILGCKWYAPLMAEQSAIRARRADDKTRGGE